MNNAYKMSDEEDPQLLTGLTPGTSDQVAPAAAPPSPSMAPPAAVPPQQPAVAPTASLPAAAAPTPRLPGMPSSVTPDQIQAYLGAQKGNVNKYGANAQMDLQNALNQRHNSLGYKLTEGGKGFADALMMGVAGAGNPNFQGQFNAQEAQYGQDQMNALRGANESNLKSTEAKMSLDKMDPGSVLSKTSQDSYGPLFQKLGYNPKAIKNMSAANIESALNLMTQYGGKEVEAMIKKYELDLEGKKVDATLANIESETQNRKDQRKQEALQELSKMPWYSRAVHPGISHALKENAGLIQPVALSHPMAGDALAWAQANSTDPRAAQILKRLGK